MFQAVNAIFEAIILAATSVGRFFRILDTELGAIEKSLEATKDQRYAALLTND